MSGTSLESQLTYSRAAWLAPPPSAMSIASARRLADGTPPNADTARLRHMATRSIEEVMIERRLAQPRTSKTRASKPAPRLAPVRYAATKSVTSTHPVTRAPDALHTAALRLGRKIERIQDKLDFY
ncbi:hypothetical protein RI054_34g133040 [Pseudoscourfieldia marina]